MITEEQQKILEEFGEHGIDLAAGVANVEDFNVLQLKEIGQAFLEGVDELDVQAFADPEFTSAQMRAIRMAAVAGLEVGVLAQPALEAEAIEALTEGYEQGAVTLDEVMDLADPTIELRQLHRLIDQHAEDKRQAAKRIVVTTFDEEGGRDQVELPVSSLDMLPEDVTVEVSRHPVEGYELPQGTLRELNAVAKIISSLNDAQLEAANKYLEIAQPQDIYDVMRVYLSADGLVNLWNRMDGPITAETVGQKVLEIYAEQAQSAETRQIEGIEWEETETTAEVSMEQYGQELMGNGHVLTAEGGFFIGNVAGVIRQYTNEECLAIAERMYDPMGANYEPEVIFEEHFHELPHSQDLDSDQEL